MKIPFFLVTGFLGSGKTTLLKKILAHYADSKKIAIIQNEFAPASIDGTDLKQSDKSFEILEINKGSVFCVCLLSDFISSLSRFIEEHQPDAVFLEASGLSDPVSILEMLQAPELEEKIFLSYIWCIVDMANFKKIVRTNTRVKHQVRIADLLVFNKCDVAPDNIHDIYNEVKTLNPFAQIVETSYCNVSFNDHLFEKNMSPVVYKAIDENMKAEGRPDIGIGVLKTTKKITADGALKFLDEATKNTVRAKGYIQLLDKTLAVQSSFGHTETREISQYQGPTELIFIGEGVKISEINKLFKNIQSTINNEEKHSLKP